MTAQNKEEMALVPIEKSAPSRVKRRTKPQLEIHVNTDAIIFEKRTLVVEVTELELETIGVRTEQEEALVGTF